MRTKKWIINHSKDIAGKTIVLTGATSGIGYETLCHLAQMNAKVVVGVRNTKKSSEQIQKLKLKFPGFDASIVKLDLTQKESILNFSNSIKKLCPNGIDALINNAGIFANPKEILKYDIEKHFFVNCIAPIYLSLALLSHLEKRKNSKLVFVSSVSIKNKLVNPTSIDLRDEKSDIKTYANSKLWLTAYAQELKTKLKYKNSNVDVNICHPGITASSLMNPSHGKFGAFLSKVCNIGMKCIFPKTKSASLNEIASLTFASPSGNWICPSGAFEVYGKPKAKKFYLKNVNTSEIYEKINKIIKKLN